MNDKLSVLFYVRTDHKNKKSGKYSIMTRITLNGKRVPFCSKLEIAVLDDWDSKAQKIKGRSDEAKGLNQTLSDIQSRIYDNYKLLSEYKIKRTAENLRDSITEKDFFEKAKQRNEIDTMVYFIEAYKSNIVDKAKTIGALIEKITWDKYDRTFRKLTGFVNYRYKNTDNKDFKEKEKFVKRGKPDATEVEIETPKGKKSIVIDIQSSSPLDNTYVDIPIHFIDFKFVKDFETYLAVELKLSHNTKSKEMQNFQGFISFVLNMQWLQRDPFHNIRITFVDSTREFLPENDLAKIMSRTFTIERLERVRDIFLFCCYTGFAFTDAMGLTYDCIENINGKQWIIKDRVKTKVDENVPLINKDRRTK